MSRETPVTLAPLGALLVLYVLAPLHNWTLVHLQGLPVARLDLLAVSLVLLVCGLLVLRRGTVRLNALSTLAIAFLAVAVLSSSYALVRPGTATTPIATMLPQFVVVVLVVFVATPQFAGRRSHLLVLLRTWTLAAAAVSLFGVYQGFARMWSLPFARLVFNVPAPGTPQHAGYPEAFGPLFRITGVFPEPAWYGVYLVPPAVFCLSLLVHASDGVLFESRRRTAIVAGLLCIGVVQSASLLAYLTFLVTVAGVTLPAGILDGKLRARTTGAVAGVAAPLLLLSDSGSEAVRRIVHLLADTVAFLLGANSTISVGSAAMRLQIADATVTAWSHGTVPQLLVGIGLNGLERLPSVYWDAASSSYLQLLVDTGLLGVGLFTALLLLTALKAYRFSNCDAVPPRYRAVGVGVTASVIATAVQFVQIGYLYPVRWLGVLAAVLYVATFEMQLDDDAPADPDASRGGRGT